MQVQVNTYKSSSPAGDLISFMAGVKKMYEDTGNKGVFYQRLGMKGASYEGSVHEFGNEYGEPIAMNQYMFDMLSPLIKSQPYIQDFKVYGGEDVQFDFDLIRQSRFCNQPKGSLNRWYGYIFPQMQTDLSKKWLEVQPFPHDKIIINRTRRHNNPMTTYYFLKNYQDKMLFAGMKDERDLFCSEWGLDIPLLEVNDFLGLARMIAGCKFFVGGHSFCFQLAEALKVPRILEVFPMLPNVIPIGENAYDFYDQSLLEYFFHKLLNNEPEESKTA